MSKSRTQILANRKRRIRRRLRERHWTEQSSPMLAATNIHYEIGDRARGLGAGGIGAMHLLARQTGLIDAIDRRLRLLKVHLPYHESTSRSTAPSRRASIKGLCCSTAETTMMRAPGFVASEVWVLHPFPQKGVRDG